MMIQIQIRQWKQVATQMSPALQGELTLRKNTTTHGLGPRDHEARPHSVLFPSVSTLTRDTAASAPSLKRTTLLDLCVSSLRRGHANLLCIVPREIHELCVSSLRQGLAIFTVLQGLTPSWSRNLRNAQRPSSCFIDHKKHQYLHSRTIRVILAQGSCPVLQILDVSSRKQKRVLQKPNTHQRLLKYVWSAIPVQIDSIRSHGERSGNPYQRGSPGANDRVQYRTHFRAVIRAKYSACFCWMRAMVISSGVCIPFLRGCPHIASISLSAPGRCESECFQGSRACPIPMTPILLPATMPLAEHAPERGTTRYPYQTIEQNCVARVGKADGHEQEGQKVNQIVRRDRTTLPQTDIFHKAHGIVQRHTANTRGTLGAKSAPHQKYQLMNSTHEGEGTRRTREGHCKVPVTKKASEPPFHARANSCQLL